MDFAAVQLLLLRASTIAYIKDSEFDLSKITLRDFIKQTPTHKPEPPTHDHHSSALATSEQWAEAREQKETEFERALLYTIGHNPNAPVNPSRHNDLSQPETAQGMALPYLPYFSPSLS